VQERRRIREWLKLRGVRFLRADSDAARASHLESRILGALTFGQIATRGAGPDENQRPPTFPCGAAGTFIVGSWLVEAKHSVIQNMAPV
jgi:hypothetical protein